VRRLVRNAGGTSLRWEVADVAEPADVVDRLRALGAVPARSRTESHATIMGLRRAPSAGPPEIQVSRVATVADFRRYVRITHEVFDALARLPAELGRIDREGEQDVADTVFVRYLAWLDGEPVAAACATFAPGGAILHAGSTLPAARGRGAYRALVRARWDEAVTRDTPALVTRAGAMSRPILERLGFELLGELELLDDDLAA
jgi:GNAT superfamily N-acetyltransferase